MIYDLVFEAFTVNAVNFWRWETGFRSIVQRYLVTSAVRFRGNGQQQKEGARKPSTGCCENYESQGFKALMENDSFCKSDA